MDFFVFQLAGLFLMRCDLFFIARLLIVSCLFFYMSSGFRFVCYIILLAFTLKPSQDL